MDVSQSWVEVVDGAVLEAQLAAELPPGHALQGVPMRAFARRNDRDDAAFACSDGRVAVMHLTYAVNRDVRWPHVEWFDDRAAWLAATREGVASVSPCSSSRRTLDCVGMDAEANIRVANGPEGASRGCGESSSA